ITSIEIAVSGEFVSSPVKVVGTRLEDNVGHSAARPTQHCVVIARRDIYCLDGFEWRYKNLQKTGALVVVDTLNLIVIAHAQLAIDFRLEGATCVKELRVLESGARRAGYYVQKVLVISIGARRQIRNYIVAAFVGLRRSADPRVRFGDRDLRVANRRPGRVRHCPEQSSIDRLTADRQRKSQEDGCQQYGHT